MESHCVDYVAMDINYPEKYAATTASAGVLEAVRKSVTYLKQGTVPYEFRTTVVKQFHDAGDFEAIGAWIEERRVIFCSRSPTRKSAGQQVQRRAERRNEPVSCHSEAFRA
ncbi:MAG: hypothetical protein V8T87_02160 [Victivallales bacterium]